MSVNADAPQRTRRPVEIIRRGRGHSYKIDGRPADGVTTLIGRGLPKPALSYWAARCVAEYVADADPEVLAGLRTLGRDGMVKALKEVPWSARDSAAARGTEVHALAEKIMRGHAVEVPDELIGHVESATAFMDQWRVRHVLTETTVASRRWHYAGTLDAVVDLPDGRRAIIDYKTGASGIWPETALQLSAYRFADLFLTDDGTELPMSELRIDCGYAIWVRADGYDAIPVECGPKVFNTFLHVAHVARSTELMSEWVGPPESWESAKR